MANRQATMISGWRQLLMIGTDDQSERVIWLITISTNCQSELMFRWKPRGKDGANLTFDGYFRAITIYGGEARLLAQSKGSRASFERFRTKYPDQIANFRQQAKQLGIKNPEVNFFGSVIFADMDKFFYTDDAERAHKIYAANPQPLRDADQIYIPYNLQ
ncbi:hypothetical protein LZ32DRAFT_653736 [Colletotrichum eremochloae]|nr:hypothetical protein LZ32DRAFT_653736 [Colletotrichum eremochloae]